MSRKRKAISIRTKLAAALACLLPQGERDFLRNGKTPPDVVIGLFEFDHIVLHAHDGSDEWHNLDPKLRAPHREKSRRDTAIVAKVKRIQRKHGLQAGFMVAVDAFCGDGAAGQRAAKENAPRAAYGAGRGKRRIPSRPFPPSRPFRRTHA